MKFCHIWVTKIILIMWHILEMEMGSILELHWMVNMDWIQNTKLFGFWKFYEYQIIPFLKMNKNQIVIFSLNYLNTKYITLNSSPPKILYVKFFTKWDEENLFLYFHTYMHIYAYLAYKKILELFGIRWQLFGYLNIIRKSQMDQIPNTNSTICSQLF